MIGRDRARHRARIRALPGRLWIASAAMIAAWPVLAADEIHWTLTGPTSVTFDWRGADSTIRYGLTSAHDRTETAVAPDPMPFSSAGPFHEARLRGLLPGTTYHYSIGDEPDHLFRTMPVPGQDFVVYVEGDVGDAVSYPAVAGVQSAIAIGAPWFVLVVGDLTYADGRGQPAVDRHFDDVMAWSRDAAYMPIWGNHDWQAPDDLRNYKGRFDLPNAQASLGAPAAGCCGEDWYWFDCGNTRFIAYPEPYPGAWRDWRAAARPIMDEAQADTAIHFIVTFGHRPALSSGYHPGDAGLLGTLTSLAATHAKYVLNLSGHSHDYERSISLAGLTHVTVGIGGSILEQVSAPCAWAGGCPPPPWCAFRALHHGALRLRFGPASIRGDAICGPATDGHSGADDITCAPGGTFDSFTILCPGPDIRAAMTLNARTPLRAPARAPVPGAGLRSPVAGYAGLSLESVGPNPATSTLAVVYSLASWEPARIELVDTAGRRVLTRDLGSPGPGRHEGFFAGPREARPGLYWLRLIQAGRSTSTCVVLRR